MDKIKVLETAYNWGNGFEFKNKEITETIKGIRILNVLPEKNISLKVDNENDKLWHIVLGSGMIRIGNEVHPFKKNDKFLIKRKELHQIKSAGKIAILELIYK